MRQREDKVVVGHGKQLRAASRDPALLGARLALGAVPVAAGVVHVALRAAGLALAVLHRAQPMRRAKSRALPAHGVGELDLATGPPRLWRVPGGLPAREARALRQVHIPR